MRSYRCLLAAWVTCLVGYACMLLVDYAPVPGWLVEVTLGSGLLVLPLAAVWRWPAPEPWVRPVRTAGTLLLLAHLLRVCSDLTGLDRLGRVALVASVAASASLLFAAAAAVRRGLAGARPFVVLDGVAAALAGAAIVSWAVVPILAAWGGSPIQDRLLVAPTLVDVLSVAAAFGAVGLVGPGRGRQLAFLAGGTALLAVQDVARAHLGATEAVGAGWLHLLGALAVGLAAAGATAATTVAEDAGRLPTRRSLGVPAVASVAAVAVLAAGPSLAETLLPTFLALLACGVCGARFVRAFLQLRELAVVREQALTDELTGIANRRALYQHLDERLQGVDADGRDEQADTPSLGVALIDLDHFKEVNDTLGHAAGDGLLKAVVARFAHTLDELDTPHLLARLGGDEFAVVLPDATTRDAAMIVGSALQESLAEPVELPEGVLHAQASIGLAIAPAHGGTRSDILFSADAAMYDAKSSGSSLAFFRPPRETSEQLTLAEELHRALERHELTVDYQPVLDTGGTVVAVEAFVRWDHPERGRLEASEFLEAAARYKLTPAIARRVLEVALADLARWRAGGIPLTMSVNLSAEDLRDDAVVALVAEALIAKELPGEALTIDISEAAIAEDAERVRSVMTGLAEIGVRIAVDDYGTGGLGLSELLALPLHEIKLDRRFTRDAAVSTRSTNIVKAVLDLTHALGLRMVAEGVEDRRAHAVLRHLGCDLLQGRHLGRPVPASEIEARIFRPTGGKHRLPV